MIEFGPHNIVSCCVWYSGVGLVGWLVVVVVVVVDLHERASERPGKYIKKEERDKTVTICSSKNIFAFDFMVIK